MKFKSLLDKERKDYFYIMHLSYGRNNYQREILWDYAKKNKAIGLDLPNKVDGKWNNEKVRKLARNKGISSIWEKQFDIFYGMRKGDIVMILSGWKSVLGVGKVEKDDEPKYDKKLSGKFFEHTKNVKWLKEYGFNEVQCQVDGFYNTLRRIEPATKWWSSLTNIELP